MGALLSDTEYEAKQFNFITRSRKATTAEELNEASLGRILHHYENSLKNSFAILTHNISHFKNAVQVEQRNGSLFDMLKTMKLGHFKLIGHIVEDSKEEGKTEVISTNTGRPKSVHVNGYFRSDGTYV